jgi:hypothetical protein
MDTTPLPSTPSTAASTSASDFGKRCALNLTLATLVIAVAGFASTAFAGALV